MRSNGVVEIRWSLARSPGLKKAALFLFLSLPLMSE